ncbi:fasciclin-like arabinogalactan protein 21 [Phoenix dactylifera]|uniref:Fasciclin-like arabinogalactan protein 21 n=1 Tax=Phoenix dactylifera TaxID=42345 RepID=A0A8B7C1M5_PHODC|nr:fasciclin-like arabinogalactan protein 21 [Phoenix dactylifera]
MPSDSSSCSHWWHAPVYLAATVALVVAALSSSSFSSSGHRPRSGDATPNATAGPRPAADLSPDAALILHRAGFHLTAAILQISPGSLLPPAQAATLFAIPDAAVADLSFPVAEHLFRYHTVPLRLSLSDLLKMPRGSCLPTLHRSKNLLITASDGLDRSISINGVPISHPDAFLHGPHAIHGASGAFHRFDGQEPVPNAICDAKTAVDAPVVVPWARVVQALGVRGYVSFSVGLSAVIDAVTRDSLALDHVTLFAPQDSGFDQVASPAPLLESAVKRHVAVGWFAYGELAAMPVGQAIRTLAKDVELRITAGGSTGAVAINGVEITEPEVYATEGVVVHGISRAFEPKPLST